MSGARAVTSTAPAPSRLPNRPVTRRDSHSIKTKGAPKSIPTVNLNEADQPALQRDPGYCYDI